MVAEVGSDAEKTRNFIVLMKMVELLLEGQIAQTIAVVGQKLFLSMQIFLYRFQALADVGTDSSIGKGDSPIVNVAVEQFETFAAARKNEVVGSAFVVVEKVVLDGVRPMSQAENEVFVPKVGVILHHMPEERPVSDMHHRLGQVFGFANPHAQPTAKQH